MDRQRPADGQPGAVERAQPAETPVQAAPVLPAGLPHPGGPRLMIEKGAFSSRTVVVLPDGSPASEPELPA